jgi:hypothetical protein
MLAKAFLAVVQIDTEGARRFPDIYSANPFLPTIAVPAVYRKIIPVKAADGVNRIPN